MKKAPALIAAAVFAVTLVACGGASKSGTRLSTIAGNQFVQRFVYDDTGNLVQIIENEVPDDVNKPIHNTIDFNSDGSIASVKTDRAGMEAEVVNGNTWRLFSDDISITTTYDEHHRVVSSVIELPDTIVTNTIKRDDSGRALSSTSEVEYSDGDMESGSTTINYVYDYDDAGNYVVQYYEDEYNGPTIGEVYAWE